MDLANNKLLKNIFTITLLAMFSIVARSEVIITKKDSLIFDSYVQWIEPYKYNPFNQLLVKTATFFYNTPYKASTLEGSQTEKLIVNLREFDCTTVVETCVALSKMIKSGDVSYSTYEEILASIRYEDGHIKGYTSRLHYPSDWIANNSDRGLWKNLSSVLQGSNVNKQINFMSSNTKLYKHLANNKENIKKIIETELNIYKRADYVVIPTNKIQHIENGIQDGDIILFATSTIGLDYSHMGIACREGKTLHFIHASTKTNKVVLEPKSLYTYCNESKTCSGISVLRVNSL